MHYVFGFARNERLRGLIEAGMEEAKRQQQASEKPARIFTEFLYETTTGSWSRAQRVIAKAEHLDKGENPRYLVTNLGTESWPAQVLYEKLYCALGEMENRIKEQFPLFVSRVSAETLPANQVQLYFFVMAYVLVHGLRRLA